MRNTTLAKFANSVPYVKELRPLAKSAMGCILLKQLDYWTFRMIEKGKAKGYFYKFLSPTYELDAEGKPRKDTNGNPIIQERNGYKLGKSWCEELGFSEDEFTTAFNHFGIRYGSKKAILAAQKAGNIFKRKDGERDALYASFYDRQTHKTWYMRNHALLDQLIDDLFNPFAVTGKEGSISPEKSGYSNPDFPITVTGDSRFPITTEITSPETTAEITTDTQDTPVPGEREPVTIPLPFEVETSPKQIAEPATSKQPASEPNHDPEGFEEFYRQYPIRKGKQAALKNWNKLKPSPELKATILHNLAERKATDADWLRDFAVPWPQKYLSEERWTDEFTRTTGKPGQPPPGPKGFQAREDAEYARQKRNADEMRERLERLRAKAGGAL